MQSPIRDSLQMLRLGVMNFLSILRRAVILKNDQIKSSKNINRPTIKLPNTLRIFTDNKAVCRFNDNQAKRFI